MKNSKGGSTPLYMYTYEIRTLSYMKGAYFYSTFMSKFRARVQNLTSKQYKKNTCRFI